jgi:ubiquinone/menaquinone biosynthesis C-methylase UbiE
MTITAFEQERTGIREKIWSLLDLNPGDRVLDVGVGHTAYSRTKLIELGAKATSIDLDWLMLHKQKTTTADSVQCNAAEIPFRTKAFELSLAYFTFHEIDPALHQQTVSELCRVAKRIMVVEPNLGEDPLCRSFQNIWTESMHSINKFEDNKTMDYWTGLLKSCSVQLTIVRNFSSSVRLHGPEARDYMKTVGDNLREDGVSEQYIKKMYTLSGDIATKGMVFSDINVIIGNARY